MNIGSEIWSNIKKELLELKWVGNITRQWIPQKIPPPTSPPKKNKQTNKWYRTIRCPSTNSSRQISIFQIHQIFNISYFLNLTYPFGKKSLFPKMPKNHPNIYTMKWAERLLVLLESWRRYWQKGRVTVSDVETAFTFSPALTNKEA